MYFEALYNENRNAIPSWQGYSYQGEVAALKFLNYLLHQFQNNPESVNKSNVLIEWMEDFVIFEGNTVKQIYQVKKTLSKSEYEDVIKNFILQFKFVNDDSCEWFIIYDDVSNDELESVSEKIFNELFENFINGEIISELKLLQENRSNLDFWKEHLNLKYSDSKLKKIRCFIRKLLEGDSLQFSKLRVEECEAFTDKNIVNVIASLEQNDHDYAKFNDQVKFEKIEISSIKPTAIIIIDQLVRESYIEKNDIMQSCDIFNTLYIQLYEILMKIKNKKTEPFIICFDDIKEIFLSSEKMLTLWKERVYSAREKISRKFSDNCERCSTKYCVECQINTFLDLDFCELVDHCNLEYPKVKPKDIMESLENKLYKDKYTHLFNIILANYTKGINCIQESNFVELSKNDKRVFVSQNISDDDDDNRNDLINNISDHLDVYKEYSYILTKNFSDVIDPDHLKILENIESELHGNRDPKFQDILPITFLSKEFLKEE